MTPPSPVVPLPKAWPRHAKSAVVTAVGLARFALLYVGGWAANSPLARARQLGNGRIRAAVVERPTETFPSPPYARPEDRERRENPAHLKAVDIGGPLQNAQPPRIVAA
jgi:hypothetical protein